MALKEKLLGLEAGLLGNRVNVLGAALTLAGALEPSLSGPEIAAMFTIIRSGGGGLMGSTLFGTGTSKAYRRTKEHIKEYDTLDERFFDKMVGGYDGDRFCGYCQLQGMYLACRDYKPEALPEFNRMKKEKTKNMIPNF